MRRLPLGYVRTPGSLTLNTVLAKFGLAADLVVVDCSAGYTFGRRETVNDPDLVAKADAPDATDADRARVKSHDQLAERRTELRASVNQLSHALNIPWAGLPVDGTLRPLVTGVGFDFRPHRLPKDQLVEVAAGHGFLIGEYTHKPSLGLVLPAHLSRDIALLTPFADAPPVFVVYAGYTRNGQPLLITGTAQGNWLVMSGEFSPQAPADAGAPDIIGRLINVIRQQVQAAGGDFDANNLFAFVGPGASEDFELAGTRPEKLTSAERDHYMHTKEVPNPKGEGTVDVQYLNLRGWVTDRLRAFMPVDHVFELAHNTVTSICYTSKRQRIGSKRADGSTPIPSNAFVLRIRERGEDDDILA